MKKVIFLSIFFLNHFYLTAQFVATMEVKEPIEGICNEKEVLVLFPMFEGQDEAKCPLSTEEIFKKLNEEVVFLKENPKYKDKGMIGIVINCEGEVVRCEMDTETKSKELDKQIEDVFKAISVNKWKPAELNGRKVDSSQLFSFKIKKGIISED